MEPVYKDFKGWKTSLDGVRDFDAIPAELNEYVKFLEAELNLPITFISTGPDREALISREAAAVA
ncbi:Adenylosuccinate synthetase [compost metagenome]